MNRLRLYDIRSSRLPENLGICIQNQFDLANYVNSAQRRLLMCKEAPDDGWWGTWAEMVFQVNRTNPYITTPRNVARIQALAVCEHTVALANQFYEYLQFGNGLLPKTTQPISTDGMRQAFARNNVPTFNDISSPPQTIRLYMADPSDVGKRVLLQGTDQNGMTIYSQDVYMRVEGQFVALNLPWADAPMTFNSFTGIQKDVTAGKVSIYQVDPGSGAQVLLHSMDPGEQTAWYRRYYLHSLPTNCCGGTVAGTLQVKAMCKLDLVPVMVDTDYLLIQNPEAIIAECESIRYSEMDTTEAHQMAISKHKEAVSYLNGELTHYLGSDNYAVEMKPFGSARLCRQNIGGLI